MNNKGFAITGILYTIFILFIMTLLAILSGLNTRTKLLQQSLKTFQNDYIMDNTTKVTVSDITKMNADKKTLYDGIYIFTSGCISYLPKGMAITTPNSANNTTCTATDTITEAYRFNKED